LAATYCTTWEQAANFSGTATKCVVFFSEANIMAKLKGVIAGAVGGLAGAALMGPLHTAAAKMTKQKPPRGEDAAKRPFRSK
jgi:hypothetical protein